MVVEEIMTQDPVTIDANAPVADAMRALHELDVRHLPVVDGSELVGMLSDRDVRPILDEAFEGSFDPDEPMSSSVGAAVSDVMSSAVAVVAPEDDVVDAIDLLISHRVGALPVVDPTTGDLVGIVSYVDLLRAARELF